MDIEVYKKSDFYEDYINSQKEYYERENADAYFAERLAEKDREIALLKERICNGDVSRLTWIDDCIAKDKEIAELKQKLQDQCISCPVKMQEDDVVAELKDKLQNVSELLTETREWLIESQKMHKRCADGAIKQLRHQKYKRCLAMARWCNERIVRIEKDYAFWRYGKDYAQNFYKKWKLRWLELAEKFKEAK